MEIMMKSESVAWNKNIIKSNCGENFPQFFLCINGFFEIQERKRKILKESDWFFEKDMIQFNYKRGGYLYAEYQSLETFIGTY